MELLNEEKQENAGVAGCTACLACATCLACASCLACLLTTVIPGGVAVTAAVTLGTAAEIATSVTAAAVAIGVSTL